MLHWKLRSRYSNKDSGAIQEEDYRKPNADKAMVKPTDYKTQLTTGVLMRSGQTNKIIMNDGNTPRGGKRHNIRALLAPSHEEPIAYVLKNHTLAEIFVDKKVNTDFRGPFSNLRKNQKHFSKFPQNNRTINSRLKIKISKMSPGDNGDASPAQQTRSVMERYEEYRLGRGENHTHRFHIVPDPLCLRHKPHPSCQYHNDPECLARIILCQPYLCSPQEEDSDSPYLVVIIPSHPSNRYRREAIRDTWGSIARNSLTHRKPHKHRVAFVFLLGASSNVDQEHQVAREHALYRDIVQYDVKDRYDLLSIKSVLMLDWIQHFCQRGRYFLKTDDDVFLNISNVLKVMEKEPEKGVLIGSMHANSQVQRNGQWKVGREIYPSPTYPTYCSGTAYVMSKDVAKDLYGSHYKLRRALLSTSSHPVPMEDVYITGVLAEQAGLACRDSKVFPNWTTGPSPRTLETFLQGKVLGIHGLSSSGIYGLERVARNCPGCAENRTILQQWFPLLTGAS